MLRSSVVIVFVCAGSLLGVGGCGGPASEKSENGANGENGEAAEAPKPVAQRGTEVDLRLPTIDGAGIDFASLRGRVVVANFTGTNTFAAQIDLHELRAVRAAEKRENHDVALVEIALEPGGIGLIAPWAKAEGIDWQVALPTEDLSAGKTAFGAVTVVPTTFVIDQEGRLVWRALGPLPRGVLGKIVHPLETGGSVP